MSKNQSVKVGIRIRPLNKRQTQLQSPVCVGNNDNILNIKKDKEAKEFVFDYVFGIDTRQESIYENCAFNLVEKALEGYNGTVFAYGQTGAGKTFTMVGDYKDAEIKGIIPRTFDHVIAAIQTSEEKKYVVRSSFIEIYNEEIMDLLEEKRANAKKDLKENPQKGVFIKDLKMIPVKSVDEMFHILDLGNKNRSVSATKMNATSSRSHALFTVHIESLEGADKVKASKINLVDLAGSERQAKTEATGDRLKEGAKINLSLTALGNVINALVDGKKNGHIPYRDSKLTRLLQDSLGGNTKTLMIASVSPAEDNYDETLSTLRYAARARNIKNTPKINEDPKDAMIREYLQQIQKLKKQLAIHGGGEVAMNEEVEEGHTYLSKTVDEGELKKMQEQVEEKLHEKDDEIKRMKSKLMEMEQLVLKKEEVSPQVLKNRKLKKKKAMKQEELIEKRLNEINEEDNKLLDDDDQMMEKVKPEEQVQYWKKIAKKLRKKLKNAIQDKKDVQRQFQIEREDLNLTIRSLQGDFSFYTQVAQKFVSKTDLNILRQSSAYDEEKRAYILPPFLIKEGEVSLPKSLKRYEVEDLWEEKRKNNKMQLLSSDLPNIEKKEDVPLFVNYNEPTGNPFLQTRRKMFKAPDYEDEKYKEKQVDLKRQTNTFFARRTANFSDTGKSWRSRSSSRGVSKLYEQYRIVTAKAFRQIVVAFETCIERKGDVEFVEKAIMIDRINKIIINKRIIDQMIQKTQSLQKKGNQPQKKTKKSMATLRLEKDLQQFESEAISFVTLEFPSEDSLTVIIIHITPEQNSPYFTSKVSFTLTFPESYPIDPPKLKCINKIFHPNINYNGSVCLPLVREDWSPTVSLSSIIYGLIFILTYPEGDDALEPQIGEIMKQDYKLYCKIVEHTILGRSFKNKHYDCILAKKKTKKQ